MRPQNLWFCLHRRYSLSNHNHTHPKRRSGRCRWFSGSPKRFARRLWPNRPSLGCVLDCLCVPRKRRYWYKARHCPAGACSNLLWPNLFSPKVRYRKSGSWSLHRQPNRWRQPKPACWSRRATVGLQPTVRRFLRQTLWQITDYILYKNHGRHRRRHSAIWLPPPYLRQLEKHCRRIVRLLASTRSKPAQRSKRQKKAYGYSWSAPVKNMGALYRDWMQTGNNVCFRVYQFWLYTIRAEVGKKCPHR